MAESIPIGSIVQVKAGTGIVRYAGYTKFKEGVIWVGLELDGPTGKNNGTVQGVKYFSCKELHGLFVKLQDIPKENISPPVQQTEAQEEQGEEKDEEKEEIQEEKEEQIQRDNEEEQEEQQEPVQEENEQEQEQEQEYQEEEQPEESQVEEPQEEQEEQLEDTQEEKEIEEYTEEQPEENEEQEEVKESEEAEPEVPQIPPLSLDPPSEPSLAEEIEEQEELAETEETELLEEQEENEANKTDKSTEIDADKEALQARIIELEENLELITLDKELAEEKIEDLELQVKDLTKTVKDLQTLAKAANLSVSQHHFDELKSQNIDLLAKLGRLRDLSATEREAHKKAQEELDALRVDNESLQQLLEAQIQENADMMQAVDDALTAQQLVDQLTEKNLKLEEDIAEQKAALDDMSMLRDLSEEVEAHHVDVERILRSKITEMAAAAQAQENKMGVLQDRLKDSMHTVEQFRVLVQDQQERLYQHEQKESELAEKATTLIAESQVLLDQNIQLQAKTQKARTLAVESELLKLDLAQARDHLNTLISMLPTTLFTIHDSSPLHLVLLTKRIAFKCRVLDDTLRRDGILTDSAAATSDACASVEKMEFMAKLWLHLMDNVSFEAYVHAGQALGEVIGAERALNSCLALLTQRDTEFTLTLYETQCAPSLALGAERMEAALGEAFGVDVHPVREVLAVYHQASLLFHATSHVLAGAQAYAGAKQELVAELYTLQSVWGKIVKCIEAGARDMDVLEGMVRACEVGQYILSRLAKEANPGGVPWLSDELHILFRDVAVLVDRCTLEAVHKKEEHFNIKKNIEKVRTKLAEADGMAAKLAEALATLSQKQDNLATVQAAFEEARKDLREKEEYFQKKEKLDEQTRQTEAAERAAKFAAYDEQVEALQKMLDLTNAELTKFKSRSTTLEGKLRELMDLSGKQKKQLLQQQQLLGVGYTPNAIEPPSPRVVSEDDKAVYLSAINHLQRKCRKLQSDLVACSVSTFSPIHHESTPATSLQALRLLPPLPSPVKSRDPHYLDLKFPRSFSSWMHNSTRALASVKVVDLVNKDNAGITVAKQVREVQELYKNGADLYKQMRTILAPRNPDNQVAAFVPAHVNKIATSEQVHFGRISVSNPAAENCHTHVTNMSYNMWREVHSSFCVS